MRKGEGWKHQHFLEEEERQSQFKVCKQHRRQKKWCGKPAPDFRPPLCGRCCFLPCFEKCQKFSKTSSVCPTYLAPRNRLEKYHALRVPLSIFSPSLLICCICCCVLTPESRKRTLQVKYSALPNVIPRRSKRKNKKRKAERIPETHQDEQMMPQKRNIDTLLTKRIAGVDC